MNIHTLDYFYRRQAPLYNISRQTILFNHREAVEALDIGLDDVVYDVACGTGKNIPHLLKKITPDRIHGFDYSHALLAQARRMFPMITFHHADVTRGFAYGLPQPTKIICSYSLTMIQDRQDALQQMISMLSIGGVLVILDFDAGWKPRGLFGHLLKRFLRWCDINLDQDVISLCTRLGLSYSIRTLNHGYNMIITIKK